MILTNYIDEHFVLDYQVNESEGISSEGILEGAPFNLVTQKEKLEDLPFFDNEINWTFDY